MTPQQFAEHEVSSFIAEEILERREKAYRVWRKRKAELGDANEFLRSQMGTIRSVAGELLSSDLSWATDEALVRAELRRLAK
jgi:galactokinase